MSPVLGDRSRRMLTPVEPVNSEQLHDEIGRRLRVGGHRYTSGRQRVVAALCRSGGPATIPEIVELDVGLAQSSVYRNLAILEQSGVVTRVVTRDDHGRFELAESLTNHPHHHLICTNCGSVSDFELAAETESALRRSLARIGRSARFRIDTRRLDLLGVCSTCP